MDSSFPLLLVYISILDQFLTTCPGICVACMGRSGSLPGPLGGLPAVETGDDGCPELEDAEEGCCCCVVEVLAELDWFCLDCKQQQKQQHLKWIKR